MKKEAVTKLKFKRLQRHLRLPMWQTMGLLEALWHCTLTNAPDGDIGKLSNDDIAAAIEWEEDADNLINALVQTGWLDDDDTDRLIVHDWSHHVPDYMRGAYKKHGKTFADERAQQRQKIPSESAGQPPQQVAQQVADNPAPNLTNPNQTHPSPPAGVGLDRQLQTTFPLSFTMWFQSYPKPKQTKIQKTYDLWEQTCEILVKRGRTRVSAEDWLMERLRRFCRSPVGKSKYCPNSDNWLRDGRYDDNDESWDAGTSDQPRKQKIPKAGDPYSSVMSVSTDGN